METLDAPTTARNRDRAAATVAATPTGLLIGGEWRPGSAGDELDVLDPATGDVVASVAEATPEDAVAAMDAAVAAQPAWGASSPRERSDLLMRAFTALMDRQDDLAAMMTFEMGKPLAEARGEIAYAAEFLRWFSQEALRIEGRYGIAPSGANRVLVSPRPVGPTVAVTPWNFPMAMGARKLAPAIAAGCTTVLKPAEQTPLCSLALADLLGEVGAPDGVVNVLNTSNPGPVVDALLHHPGVRKLTFTGSTDVGRLLLRSAADQVLRTSMELGGNAPFVVFDDADLDVALDGAMDAKLRNTGQACTAANRFLVHRAVADDFTAGLAERMRDMVVGPGLDESVQVGPLVDRAARDKVERLVGDALDRSARVVVGGERPDGVGWFYPPTVLADVDRGADLNHDEIFGPVAAISTFDDTDEAIAMANDTIHGLVSYVFTRDLDRALDLVDRLDTGMVGINRGLVSDPAAPFGGVKQSGLGREGGSEGIWEFLETRYAAIGTSG
ncbi:NAD-dependent succinate-semialdehyde dehydrogenase [Salsipaludibacter albus]|uniref:NAD-dependent succinate-semialdehyde dehydrogenase n=1 Tax=Salsipaludibacter albus TaxID=2849650 RepID=UPI001EE4E5A4|nr:NAD-dependent succinate-semialdehyde dehydrogenase [Salsipaludibacter albus]MBY5161544.1 NAD-dependent succinate-semialdehyde dehydrogenase [Salsipaludibacter albus]